MKFPQELLSNKAKPTWSYFNQGRIQQEESAIKHANFQIKPLFVITNYN